MSDLTPPEDPTPPPPGEPSGGLPPAPGEAAVPAPEEGPAPTRKRGAIIAVVVAFALVLACSAGAFAYFKLRGAPGAVLDKVPANADVVFVAHLDPAASQKANLFRMTEKFPDLGSREQLTQRFNQMVDEALSGSGLTHDDLSWIGGEAGGFVDVGVGTPAYGLIVAVDDAGAANAALGQIRDQETNTSGTTFTSTSISGVDVWVPSSSDQPTTAVFDGVAVIASDENAMRSVIDTANGASTVEDDAVFRGVMDRLPDDNLGFVYVNVHELLSLLNSIPAGVIPNMPPTAQFEALQGVGFSVAAEPDGVAIDSVVTTDPSKLSQAQRDALANGDQPNPLLPLTPADAYGVLAVGGAASNQGMNPAAALNDALDQIAQVDGSAAQELRRLHVDDLLKHFTGDAAVQVAAGTGLLPVGGTVAVGIDDADAVSAWLDRYVPVLLSQGVGPPRITTTSEEHDGVRITVLSGKPELFQQGAPFQPISWAVLDDALIVGVSPENVAKVIDLAHGKGDAITTDRGYTAATADVPGTNSVLYVDVQAILTAVKGILPADQYQEFLDQGGRDVEPIEAVVAGGTSDENGSTTRLLIKIP
jgi:hypothetical protein